MPIVVINATAVTRQSPKVSQQKASMHNKTGTQAIDALYTAQAQGLPNTLHGSLPFFTDRFSTRVQD